MAGERGGYLVDDGKVRLGVRRAVDLLEQLEEVVTAPAQCVMSLCSLVGFGIPLHSNN